MVILCRSRKDNLSRETCFNFIVLLSPEYSTFSHPPQLKENWESGGSGGCELFIWTSTAAAPIGGTRQADTAAPISKCRHPSFENEHL